MSYLIGGSGSSGTSFLRQVLNEHPDIFSGAELSFFNKERLFKDWNKWKRHLTSSNSSFSTDGWTPYVSHNLAHECYGWEQDELADLIEKSNTLLEFVNLFFERPLKMNNKSIWVEKTPSNTYGFQDFLGLSDEHGVIHMVRNPYDTVASLMKRGMSPFFSTGLWVYNNSLGLAAKKISTGRYHLQKYENLVYSFDSELASLIAFLGASTIKSSQLYEENNVRSLGIKTWNNSPSGSVSNTSVGAFNKLDKDVQETIKHAIHTFRIRDNVTKLRRLEANSAAQLCEIYDYEYHVPQSRRPLLHIKDLIMDFSNRSVRGYSTGWLQYPGKVVIK